MTSRVLIALAATHMIRLLRHDLKMELLALNEAKLDRSIDLQITDIAGYDQELLDKLGFDGCISTYVRNTIKFIRL